MDLGLNKKVIIISGGARGIGAAIARTLSGEGAVPVIFDKLSDPAELLINQLKSMGFEAHFLQIDLSLTASIQDAVKNIVEKYGAIHGLVNNAGINDSIGLEGGDPEAFRDSLSKNLFHYYDLTHFCIPELKKSSGSILNIASKVALTGQGGTSGYAASKGAQLALTREWAVELLKYNIRVNAILPAEVMTPLYENWIKAFDDPDKKLNEIQQNIPLGKRMTTVEEIASMAAYLISDQASHITGQQIHVDGGYVHLDRSLDT